MIESVTETQVGRQGSYSLADGRQDRNYTRVFVVKTDPFAGQLEVAESIGIWLGESYAVYEGGTPREHDNFVFCSDINVMCRAPKTWDVTATYSLWNPDYNTVNPLDSRPRVSLEWQPTEIPIDVDWDGNPVVTSVGLPYDPSVTREFGKGILRIQWNVASIEDYIDGNYNDSINKDIFLGRFKPKTVKVSSIQIANEFYDPTQGKYWRMSAEFGINQDTWVKRVLDASLVRLDDTDPTGYGKIYINGVEATSPVPMDGAGQPLQPPITSDTAVYNEHNIYNEMDFEVFGFDPSILS